jgi:hypothetical protein
MEREACLRAGGSTGMDVRTEARCGEEARTYPASEFSYIGFSSAGLCCFPSCQNCSIKGTHWAHPAFRGRPRGALHGSPTARRGRRDRRNAAEAGPVTSDVALLFATPNSSRRKALMSCRWLVAVARVERTGARSSRAVVKTALTCGFPLSK